MSIEIASVKFLPGNAARLAYVHQAAVRRYGRPHWGQDNKLHPVSTAMLYSETLPQWREALLGVTKLSTQFSNAFTRARGLEAAGIFRLVTSVRRSKGATTHVCNDYQPWSPVPVAEAIAQIRQAR